MELIYINENISVLEQLSSCDKKALLIKIIFFFSQKIKKKKISKMFFKFFLVKHREEALIPPPGLGDVLYTLLTYRTLKKKFKYILLNKKHFCDVAYFFADVVDTIVYVEPNECEKIHEYMNLHPLYRRGKADNFLDLFKNYLQAEIEQISTHPVYKNDIKFQKKGYIQNKTVLICPETTTLTSNIPKDYWISYASKLEDHGYTPVFNSKDTFGKYESILLPIKDTVEFVNYAGNVIGYRSGIFDILAYFTDAKFIILYPNYPGEFHRTYINNYDEDPAKKYMNFCSLKKIHKNKEIIELLFRKDNFQIP